MRAYSPDELVDAEAIGYSHAVETDGHLTLSGQVGWDGAFETPERFPDQVRRAFENLEAVLHAAGRTRDDVTKLTAYLVDPAERSEAFLEEWRDWAPSEPYPCLTILGVAGLAREEFLVELEAEVAPE